MMVVSHSFMYAGSMDKRIVLWYMEDMTVVNVLEAEGGGVRCLSLSKDNTFLVAGTDENKLSVYAFTTGTLLHHLQGHNARVTVWGTEEKNG